LTLLSTEASALDINGLAAMALNYARNHGGYRCAPIANRPALASSQHRPSAVRRSVEASAISPADTMVSLDRPLNDEAASRPAR